MTIQASTYTTAKVTSNHAWTDRLYSLRLHMDQKPFEPGQFVRLQLDIDGEKIAKPYSLVNAPADEELEVFFNTLPNGRLSNELALLQPGDEVEVSQPASGFFVLSEIPDREQLWLIATGTGFGPYLSMLGGDEIWRRFTKILLVHCVPLVEELVYRDLIAQWYRTHAHQFVYVPCVTREPNPHGPRGRVTDLLASGVLERFAGSELNKATSHLMLCGNHNMIDDMKALLAERGMRKHLRRNPGHISTEQYY